MPWKTLSATLSVGSGTDGWNLAEHPGEVLDEPRTFTSEVWFASAFSAPPAVLVSLTGFDLDQRHSARVSVRAVDITASGFKVQISTWHDSRVYGTEVSWLAIGP